MDEKLGGKKEIRKFETLKKDMCRFLCSTFANFLQVSYIRNFFAQCALAQSNNLDYGYSR